MLWVGITLVGLAVAALNVWGTLRIWRSGVYERGQLLAQTAFIWILPGAAIAVVSLLSDGRRHHSGDDPSAANPQDPNAEAMNGFVGHDSP
jgi:hypothetical protein